MLGDVNAIDQPPVSRDAQAPNSHYDRHGHRMRLSHGKHPQFFQIFQLVQKEEHLAELILQNTSRGVILV